MEQTDAGGSVSSVVDPLEKWCESLSQLIPGLRFAYVLLASSRGLADTECSYPANAADSTQCNLAARLALQSGSPVIGKFSETHGNQSGQRIARPISTDGQRIGAVVVEVSGTRNRQAETLAALSWAETSLTFVLRDRRLQGTHTDGVAGVIAAGAQQTDYRETVVAVLLGLRDMLGCTRVALGRATAKTIRIEAVSGLSDLDRRKQRAKTLETAMQAVLDNGETLLWPAADSEPDAPALALLVRDHGLGGACGVPLPERSTAGSLVLLFEFPPENPPTAGTAKQCRQGAVAVGPLLQWHHERQRGWWTRLRQLLGEVPQQLLGSPGQRGRWLAIGAVTGLMVFAALPTDYRVTAPVVVEGAVQRAIVAPYDGFLADSEVRAGQTVRTGQLLARLDDREMREQLRQLNSEAQELDTELRQALARLDHGEGNVLKARRAQVAARMELLESQLQRHELRAPFDGFVLSGDWSRSQGVPIKRGDVLFEIGPLDAFRIALSVDDADINHMAPGQTGEFVLTALPRQPIDVTLTDLASIADSEAIEPRFRVEAEPATMPKTLRPGMEGVAKITVGQRKRWWIWTHELTDWIRLQLWRWLP